ncbi:Dual specificity phosphatase DUPD1 [Orchesella cincta]|uniref:Dual specificity protein phosphatase n=1 Tax=Orchesella cincta TaxID=48709 RepID=A0A1D2NLY3_ORCCI|nr:Dual specificity phosphatase DUPD1 [Orchesella cincta]
MPVDPKKFTKQSLKEILHHRHVSQWNHMDEVYPGIYVGDEASAKDTKGLELAGITHVLNASYITSASSLGVNTSAQFYQIRSFKCEFLGIPALDIMTFKISPFFDQAANFIESALNSNGKVLVHCYMGVSRSATLVMAYLMLKKKMSATEALSQLRTARNVFPNDGFMDEICELDLKLKAEARQ